MRLMEINERKKKQELERYRRYRQQKKKRTVENEVQEDASEEVEDVPDAQPVELEQSDEENVARHVAHHVANHVADNVADNVARHADAHKNHAPTGQDSTPQDKTEQYTTQPPPSGSGAGSAAAEQLIEEFRSRLGGMSPTARKELKSFLKTMEPEVCLRALDIGCDNGHPKWAYVRAILNRWRQSGVKVPSDLHGREAAPKQGNSALNTPDNATFAPSKPADGVSCYSGVQGDPLGRKRLEAYLKGLREG